jgi:hypothetical protein
VILAPPPDGAAAALAHLLCDRAAGVLHEATGVEPEVLAGPEGLAGAAGAATSRAALLILRADAPLTAAAHVLVALDDLADGVAVAIGPALDGSAYLLAAAPGAALPDGALGDLGLQAVFAAAAAAGGELVMGLLRAERRLRTPADARALLADPLTPRPVADALRQTIASST